MHRVMALSTVLMNASGVCVAVLFAIAAHSMPEMATRSGPIYVGVLMLATFASERIRAHVLRDGPTDSAVACRDAVRISRALLALAWLAMIVLLIDLGVREWIG